MGQMEIGKTATVPTRWQKVKAWLLALEQAVDHDPHEHMEREFDDLRKYVVRLEARLDKLDALHAGESG